ncbi:MAG: hypothetical protein U1F10_00575 [Burkholderiales bacterium]
MPKPRLKTVTLTVRIEPQTKEALAAMANAERRSLANMLELLVLERFRIHPASQPDKPKEK